MLREIQISGLAIIDQSVIEFGPGLNIITGETGAGKSIIVKALGLLLGAKSDAGMIRSEREQASVCAEFSLSKNSELLEKAIELGLTDPAGTQDTLLIRRTIYRNGRSKAWINDHPVTINTVRFIAEELLDLFSQHESHAMLNAKHHLGYIDQFLKDQTAKPDYQTRYQSVQKNLRVLFDEVSKLTKLKQEEDYLSFRYKEFEVLEPSESDYEEITEEINHLENSWQHREWLSEANQIIEASSDYQVALQKIYKISQSLSGAGKDFLEFSELAKTAVDAFNELSYFVSRFNNDDDNGNESQMESLRSRLSEYKELMRKTGSESIADLVQKGNDLAGQLESIVLLEAGLDKTLIQIRKDTQLLMQAAAKLSKERVAAAKIVAKDLEGELKSLVMPNARVSLEFAPVHSALQFPEMLGSLSDSHKKILAEIADALTQLNSGGLEQAQFLLSANPGESLKPLQKVVSGGELSRIMLALKKALSAGASTCVLVFDEIDTGISGLIADVVGQKLKELASNFQIICISHLPQVAVYADEHFLVSKSQSKDKTETSFEKLSPVNRQKEIARLLSGPKITPSSLANAKTLLSRSQTSRE